MILLAQQSSIIYHLPVLLIVVSLVYTATRHDEWPTILRESVGWLLRMVGFLASIGVLLYVLSTYPHRWPYIATVVGVGMAIYYWFTSPLFRRFRKT